MDTQQQKLHPQTERKHALKCNITISMVLSKIRNCPLNVQVEMTPCL